MKRKIWIAVISILGLIILIQLAGMLLARLGVPVYYIQSDGNGIQLVRSTPQKQSLPALQPNNKRLTLLEQMEENPEIDIDSRKITMVALNDLVEGKVKFDRTR